jgi:hypothetical protein
MRYALCGDAMRVEFAVPHVNEALIGSVGRR